MPNFFNWVTSISDNACKCLEDVPEAIFANANKPFVLKHLRDFYRSKGSQKSFELIHQNPDVHFDLR